MGSTARSPRVRARVTPHRGQGESLVPLYTSTRESVSLSQYLPGPTTVPSVALRDRGVLRDSGQLVRRRRGRGVEGVDAVGGGGADPTHGARSSCVRRSGEASARWSGATLQRVQEPVKSGRQLGGHGVNLWWTG